MQNITTLQDAEQYAAQHGIAITGRERAQIAEAQRAELARLQALDSVASAKQTGRAGRMVESFNRFYPKFLESLVRVAEIFLTLAQTVIVAFGVPAVLVLLLVVEHQRVLHGIALFELDSALASFAAAALVVANLTLEFTIHYVESKAGYQAALATRWSLRTWAHNAAYTLGLGERWTPQQLSPAQRYRALLRLVTLTILALALAGSMRAVIQEQPGTWHEALIAVVTSSSLSEMSTWLSGLLFALAAVLTAQGLSRYVALRTAEIVASMGAPEQEQPTARYAAQLEAAGAAAVLAVVNAKLQAKAEKQRAQQDKRDGAKVPFGSPVPEPDEDEDTRPTEPQPGQNAQGLSVRDGVRNVTK